MSFWLLATVCVGPLLCLAWPLWHYRESRMMRDYNRRMAEVLTRCDGERGSPAYYAAVREVFYGASSK